MNINCMLQVAVFSDSQLRPIIQGEVRCPSNWYVNSTPGGTFNNVACEVRNCQVSTIPGRIVFLVGTNDMMQHLRMEKVEKDFFNLIETARSRFPDSKVRLEANFQCEFQLECNRALCYILFLIKGFP